MVKLEEPDKGQAWVVAMAACIINMILSGLSRMIGLLYVAVLDTYGVSRQEATLPFTVRNSIRCLAGPLVGVVGQRYGIRVVTFGGGVVASAGAALCCLAPNIVWLAVFWGGMHGLGFAFANTLFQVVVNQYFQKYRATASGIALSGACVGSFVFPFMIEAILDTFGLAGGFLILGGVVMHVLPPSLLLRSPPWIQDPERYARLKALKMMKESVETLEVEIPDTLHEVESIEDLRRLARSTSLSNCPIDEFEVCSASSKSLRGSCENLANSLDATHTLRGKCRKDVICTLYRITESPPLDRRHSSMQNDDKASMNNRNGSLVPTISGDLHNKDNLEKESPAEAEKKEAPVSGHQVSLLESFKTIAVLYVNPAYMLISLCMTTYVIIFIPILTVIVDYSKDKGIPESAGKYLINSMAMGDLIGRLCFGWVTDRGHITIPVFMTLSFICQGITVAMFPYALSLYSYMLLLTLYGITAGTVLVHFPLLVLKYVEINQQSVAMGCVGFMSGIVSFAIPPLIGHFRDTVGSYDGMFYLTGGISVVSGGLWLLEPVMLRCHHKRGKELEIKKQIAEQQQSEMIIETGNISKSKGHNPPS